MVTDSFFASNLIYANPRAVALHTDDAIFDDGVKISARGSSGTNIMNIAKNETAKCLV